MAFNTTSKIQTPYKSIWVESPAPRESTDTASMSVARKWKEQLPLYSGTNFVLPLFCSDTFSTALYNGDPDSYIYCYLCRFMRNTVDLLDLADGSRDSSFYWPDLSTVWVVYIISLVSLGQCYT
jgi:hypothetical protein